MMREKLSWEVSVLADGVRHSVGDAVELRRGANTLRIAFRNRSGRSVKLDGFQFDGSGISIPGPRLRLYREGWTAVAAAATRRYGERDFFVDPDYRRFAVVDADDYNSDEPNCFQAENVVVLNDSESGLSLLAGFVTAADYYNRFRIRLDESGVREFSIFVYGDGREVAPGETVLSEELLILEGPDGYALLEQYAACLGDRMKAHVPQSVPTGWCSWYYYYSRVTENDALENLEWLRRHRTELPLEYFQIDDGYQSAPGDWLMPSEQFSHGPKFILEKIAEAGFRPGLWLAPFMVRSDSRLFREHPEFLIRDVAGEILYPIKWRGIDAAILDCSREDACHWLRELFATLKEWGCTYAKLDFMMYESCVTGGVFHDRRCTRAQAFRRGLQAIRDGAGEDMFILGGTVVLGSCVGLLDGCRVGPDITPYWRLEHQRGGEAPSVPNVCRNIINRRYMHRRLWLNDPDVLIVRQDNNRLTEPEVLLWVSALWLTGGLLLLSDRFATLDPERAGLARLLLEEQDAFEAVRPVDFFEREIPAVWSGVRRKDRKPVLGFFNLGETPLAVSADLEQLGTAEYPAWREYWTGRVERVSGKRLSALLEPHCAMLFFPVG